jgi:hypothetical protein
MAKFKVKVTIKAECSYEIEMDTDTEARAEDDATKLWRQKLPDDFQIEKGYITDWETETEQLTAVCPRCGTEHAIPTAGKSEADSCWYEDYDYCKPCGAKIEAEDKASAT